MTKKIFFILLVIFSCSDSANDNSHLRQPQQTQSKEKLSFPFTTKDKVDTSKMMKIDYSCAIDNFNKYRIWGDSAHKNNMDLRVLVMKKGYTNNEFYLLMEAFEHCENKFFKELKSAKIPILKMPKNISAFCFIDSLKREYFINLRNLQNKPFAIFYNGK